MLKKIVAVALLSNQLAFVRSSDGSIISADVYVRRLVPGFVAALFAIQCG